MQFPLYNYYLESDLALEEIIDNYLGFYIKQYGRDKAQAVARKVMNSSKIAALDAFSVQQHAMPNYIDFGSAVNETLWFVFQSNKTQALAVLIAAKLWDQRVNSVHHLGSPQRLRDDALKIFLKYSIYEEMPQVEFERMTGRRL